MSGPENWGRSPHAPQILSTRDVQVFVESTWPQIPRADHELVFRPLLNRRARTFGDFEANRFLRFAFQDSCALLCLSRSHEVDDFHLHEIATLEFAVACHVERCEVLVVIG
jgi:hypothetical protein